MSANLSAETPIRDLRGHPPEVLTKLRALLAEGVELTPDLKRPDFYEVRTEGLVYYIYVLPTSGKVLLLATWPA